MAVVCIVFATNLLDVIAKRRFVCFADLEWPDTIRAFVVQIHVVPCAGSLAGSRAVGAVATNPRPRKIVPWVTAIRAPADCGMDVLSLRNRVSTLLVYSHIAAVWVARMGPAVLVRIERARIRLDVLFPLGSNRTGRSLDL